MNIKSSLLVLPLTLLCAAFLRSKLTSKPGAKLESTAVRQSDPCDSPRDCLRNHVCVGNTGICSGTNCNGVCIPESALTDACSCEVLCSSGFTCSVGQFEGVEIRTCVPDNLNSFLPDEVAQSLTSPYTPLDCSPVSVPNETDNPFVPFPQDQGGPAPCISVDMLSTFVSHELVFEKHVLTRVLCDDAGSCATRGHVVYYNGMAMMMKSYCDNVGCKEKIMEVNSPKYRRGLQVPSRSDGMYFTAFAARYETRAEESILAIAVRIGL